MKTDRRLTPDRGKLLRSRRRLIRLFLVTLAVSMAAAVVLLGLMMPGIETWVWFK